MTRFFVWFPDRIVVDHPSAGLWKDYWGPWLGRKVGCSDRPKNDPSSVLNGWL